MSEVGGGRGELWLEVRRESAWNAGIAIADMEPFEMWASVAIRSQTLSSGVFLALA